MLEVNPKKRPSSSDVCLYLKGRRPDSPPAAGRRLNNVQFDYVGRPSFSDFLKFLRKLQLKQLLLLFITFAIFATFYYFCYFCYFLLLLLLWGGLGYHKQLCNGQLAYEQFGECRFHPCKPKLACALNAGRACIFSGHNTNSFSEWDKIILQGLTRSFVRCIDWKVSHALVQFEKLFKIQFN